jgi:nucleotide-binding universal stress UspA family protein
MYNKILVPLDGSERAEEILPHVVKLALKFQSTVTLMQVVEIKIGAEGVEFMPMAGGSVELVVRAVEVDKQLTETYLNKIKSRLQAQGVDTKVRVAFGSVVAAVISAAQQENVDLIAMASHGRTGAACVFYGCVTAGVLHRIDRPLLIIRSRQTD